MLFFNKTDEEASILIDVGNGTVTGSIVVFKNEQKPLFVYVTRSFFSINEMLEGQNLEIEMKSILEQVLTDIMKRGFESKYWVNKKRKIDRVMLSFSSPWFLSKTKNINLKNDKEFVITKNFLNDVLQKEITLFKNELSTEHGGDVFEIIEKSIVHSKINGYALDVAMGKTTKNFDASLYMSVVHNVFLTNIIDTIQKHTHIDVKNIHIHTFPLVAFSVLRDMFTKESDFLFMDITSEITDITLVKDDIIDKTVSIPSGKNFVIRQISKNLNVSSEIAESTLRLFIEKKLDEPTLIKVSDILILVEKEWSIYLENALMEISPEMMIPSTLFLTTDKNMFDVYNNFLSIQKMDATNLFRKNLKINRIDLESMSKFYENQTGFVLDEFIVLISLFYKKILLENK